MLIFILNELDYFIKHSLREKWYLRYCDDFLIINQSRHYLLSIIPKVSVFLNEKLKLKIHPVKINIRSWSQGIDFVGYVHSPYGVVLRTKTKHRFLYRINSHNFSSYFGVCQHADTFELKQLMQNKIGKDH
ncbi:MAG: hypothetical protein A2729_02935 [Candidatus Buchananbacteria bacterium RIFCSPHIGHO2_01_FULL_39_14]|uniref:Reverse transcriptase domain-containing protein n=2 Tax=Candidatus Buchananiibacteriota TaxID=1817903 RepID=A0A1G1YW85_9BACT|nr:MAG: hypothetical protein A2729_02935 [Candidatus Buchananbacteria bacterium RIFCSPHIGHO2_01_FULL_39_14]OGY49420.1 MAG: hypothetical protein A3D39_02680 [Candidatus Buchananbacteria bacterium RIFCSPHIGHO2_02_FULL_39_17]OGY55657.1 MAG: hypothetical protein A2912_05625 [Candidatus Buchananbacteria bacterium RIFCSPLOWO2_01_FULL_40_23b]